MSRLRKNNVCSLSIPHWMPFRCVYGWTNVNYNTNVPRNVGQKPCHTIKPKQAWINKICCVAEFSQFSLLSRYITFSRRNGIVTFICILFIAKTLGI